MKTLPLPGEGFPLAITRKLARQGHHVPYRCINISEHHTAAAPGGAQKLFHLHDGHGSTRLLLNDLVELVQRFAYDAYGNHLSGALLTPSGGALTSLLYSGEFFDKSINQQYLRARWYDATTGRFNRLDPFAGNPHDPQSLHKYAYVHGDPVNGWDPTGLVFSLTENMVSTFIQRMLNAINFGFKIYRAYDKVTDVLDIIDTARTVLKFLKALEAVTVEAAIVGIFNVVRSSFGGDGLETVSQGLSAALQTMDQHWDEIRQAISDKIPEMSRDAAGGVRKHLTGLIAASKNNKLKYVFTLPSGPGNYDTSSKKIVSLGKKIQVEVTPTGGSIFGLTFQKGSSPDDRVPVIRIDYWDVRALTLNKLHVHYHTLPKMKKDHKPIWKAPGVIIPDDKKLSQNAESM